jgi:L-arabinose isomerase
VNWPNEILKVTDSEADLKVKEYQDQFQLKTDDVHAVHYQAKEEIAMERILIREHADAFTNTFEDLWGMEELPGIASQHLMARGFGYGAEGDWKPAAMVHIIKAMSQGLEGGSSLWKITLTIINLAVNTHWEHTCSKSARQLLPRNRILKYILWVLAAKNLRLDWCSKGVREMQSLHP